MRASILLATFSTLSLLAGGPRALAQQPGAQQPGAPVQQSVGAANGDATPDGDQPANGDQLAKAPTLAERRLLSRAQHEMVLRAMLTDFGIEEAAPQDAIVAYLAEEETARRVVRGAAQRVMDVVRSGGAPEKMRDALAIYKAALDADKERRRAAQSALDAKIGFSLSPRLEATLWVLGVLGEGQTGLPLVNTSQRAPRKALGEGARDRNRDGARDDNRDGPRRGGTVRGVVSGKAQGWIEVRAVGGAIDRYLPFWAGGEPVLDPTPAGPTPAGPTPAGPTPAGPTPGPMATGEDRARLNRLTLETLARVKIGDRVNLDWVWSERKRVVRLQILPPEAPTEAAPDQNLPAPTAPYPVAPAPAPETINVVAPGRRFPEQAGGAPIPAAPENPTSQN